MPYDIIIGRDKGDKKRFGDKGLIYLGKGYVKMENYTSLSNLVWLDVARSHVIMVAGKRGSGKSYTLGAIAEELCDLPEEVSQNIAPLIFDTMGIFWTMKHKNEKEAELLQEWGLKPKNLPVKIWVPQGYYEEYEKKQIPIDRKFAINASELSAEDWIITFSLGMIDHISIAIQNALSKLKGDYNIDDIIKKISELESDEKSKIAATSLFNAAKTWGIFTEKGQEGTKISELVEPGKSTIIDISCYSSIGAFNVRALVIGIVCKKLFNERMLARKKEEMLSIQHGADYLNITEKRESPLVWLFIDECLAKDTEIITDKAHTPIQNVVSRFENGEKFKVLGFDKETNRYGHFDITNVYRKGKRKVMKLTTETGKQLVCTPEHRVLTSKGIFASAFSVPDIATPLIQHYSTDKKIIQARILGHIYGDGWISDKTKSLGFSGKGNKQDLEKIRSDLKVLGFKSTNIFERKTKSKITKHNGRVVTVERLSQSFQSTSGYKYFRELANFSGMKTLTKIETPKYLENSSDLEKAEFLAALMGSDGQKITKAKNAKGDFNVIRFSFNKLESLRKEAFDFANQIKELFEDIGIEISSISERKGNVRKDGRRTIKIVITLKKNIENTIRFLEKIGYRYCKEKEQQGIKWLKYLKARNFLKEKREKVKKRALELHAKGLGKVKISRELNFPEAQIRDWIYNGGSPGLPKSFLDFEEWVSKREQGDILFEKVFKIEEAGEEEIYDISVDKVHNFISDSFITHNCHEFLPQTGKTAATDALIQILREGRQPGLSLVMATQQPGVIHRDAMTQSDIVIAHRVTAKPDIESLNSIMQTYLIESIQHSMDSLPSLKGSAIILDDNSERIYPMRVRPRFTWHGGEAPTAVRIKKKI